jgi:polar amino acid transport system substrate-binding protein
MSREHGVNRRSYLSALGAGGVAALAGCSGISGGGTDTDTGDATDNGNDTISIGSDIPYRPFEYENEDGELLGFDVEIAEAVFGEQLGLTPEFTDTSFDTIISSLNNGNFRVIMSAMTINDARDEEVDFSDPYFTAYQTVVVREGSDITAKEDLRGVRVGVQKGTTGADAAAELREEFDGDLQINEYDQINDAFSALLNNQVTAVVNDNTVSAEFVDGEGEGEVRFLEGEGAAVDAGDDAPPYLTLTVEEYGIAFRQDDDEFRQRVNEALAAIREDGTYDEIYNEYFAG